MALSEFRPPRVVLVTGGRDYSDRGYVWGVLDATNALTPITLLVHGGARGADTLADEWAKERRVSVKSYPVSKLEWKTVGLRAGHLRNQRMYDEQKPCLVIAFPGGAGTNGMCEIATKGGTLVRRFEGVPWQTMFQSV